MDSQKTETDEAKPIVHGDADNGFIVEHHDGASHRTHGCMADNEDEAIRSAQRKWREDDEATEASQDDHAREHAGAKRISRAEVEEMLTEHSARHEADVTDLRNRIEVQEARITELDDALSGMVAKADAPHGVSDPGHTIHHSDLPRHDELSTDDTGGYPGARRPPPEPDINEGEGSREDPEHAAFKKWQAEQAAKKDDRT